jgi:anti-sigma factor RsiW
MNCDESRPLLDAYADGELDIVRHIELEAHLKACPACLLRYEAINARRARIRDTMPRFPASQALREKIHASLRAEAQKAARQGPLRFPVGWQWWNLAGLAASVTVALLAGYSWGGHRSRSAAVADEAIAEHMRSLQASHLMDVISTDRHTVKPWFAGKLDFSPPVVDLADIGFPLAGGRLDQIDGHTAAALVFRRRLHAINVFVWPARDATPPPGSANASGFSAQGWEQGGLNFLAVSEIPAADLEQFVGEFRRRTEN